MSALLLSAVNSTGRKSGIAPEKTYINNSSPQNLEERLLSANLLLTVKSLGKGCQGGVIHTTSKTKHQVKGRFFLNVVIGKGAAILKLFAGKYQTLLIRGNS